LEAKKLAEYAPPPVVLSSEAKRMIIPTVTEITPRLEPVTRDPFIFPVNRPAPRPEATPR
jgi:hypothetical protein